MKEIQIVEYDLLSETIELEVTETINLKDFAVCDTECSEDGVWQPVGLFWSLPDVIVDEKDSILLYLDEEINCSTGKDRSEYLAESFKGATLEQAGRDITVGVGHTGSLYGIKHKSLKVIAVSDLIKAGFEERDFTDPNASWLQKVE